MIIQETYRASQGWIQEFEMVVVVVVVGGGGGGGGGGEGGGGAKSYTLSQKGRFRGVFI